MTIGICGLMMSCSFWPICSPITDRLTISVQTTVPSLRRSRCGHVLQNRCPSVVHRTRPCLGGWLESFNGKLRDELLNGETFYTLMEVHKIVVVGKADLE